MHVLSPSRMARLRSPRSGSRSLTVCSSPNNHPIIPAKIRGIYQGRSVERPASGKLRIMTVNENTIEKLTKSLRYLKNIPSGTYFCFNYAGDLSLEADTQEDVKAIRRSFRGVVWKKHFQERSNSWQYKGRTRNGV